MIHICICPTPMIKCDHLGCHCTLCGGLRPHTMDKFKLKEANVPFSKLTDAEDERLSLLSEEAGEIVQAIGKITRHGYENHHPNDPYTTNRHGLEKEIGDLLGVARAMAAAGDLSISKIEEHAAKKWSKAQPYLHHQSNFVHHPVSMVPAAAPEGFKWIDKPATIKGDDFTYTGKVLLSFPKGIGGKIRYVVMDNSRLFIQRAEQIILQEP